MEAATPSKAAEADIRSDNRVWRRVKENGNLFWAFRDPAQPQDNGNGSEPCLVSLPVDILLDMISLLDFASVNSLGLTCKSFRSLLSTNKTLWIKQLHNLSKDYPTPIPTFRDVSSLSVEELIDVCKSAFYLSNKWTEHPTPRRNVQIWSLGPKSQVAAQRLIRSGSHHWLFVACTVENEEVHSDLFVFDLQCSRRAATLRVKGPVQDLVVDLVSPREAVVAIALCGSGDEDSHWEPNNPQHCVVVYKVQIPSNDARVHATDFFEIFRIYTPYVLCNLSIRGSIIGGLAWDDGVSPTHSFLVNWREETAGIIDLRVSEPVFEPFTFLVDETTFLVYEERHTTPVIHAYLIPPLLKPNYTTVPVMQLLDPAPVPHITTGPSSFPRFFSQIVGPAPDGRISVLSASMEDQDEVDDGGLHTRSTLIHRYLEPEPNLEPEGPRIVYRPSLPNYHYRTRLHHTDDHPFHHPYIPTCFGATGSRAVWMEVNRKGALNPESDSDSDDEEFDGKRKLVCSLNSWSLLRPRPTPAEEGSVGSAERQIPSYAINEAAEHVGRLVLPPSLNLLDCPSMAFDEATGVLCVGTKRGEVWVLNYG